jgi:hypothetical protein
MEKNQIEDLIVAGEWEEALNEIASLLSAPKLKKYRSEVIGYKAALKEIGDARRMGNQSSEWIRLETSRLRGSILALLDIVAPFLPPSGLTPAQAPPSSQTPDPLIGRLDDHHVFISYAWEPESESIIGKFELQTGKENFSVIRDKVNGVGYKGDIEKFMQDMGKADCVVLVLSNKYLRSSNCMYELLQIRENKDMDKVVFPLVLGSARITDQKKNIAYVKYWQTKCQRQNKLIKTLEDLAAMDDALKMLKLYTKIKDNINSITAYFAKMNTLTPEMHIKENFKTLIDKIKAGFPR